MQYASNWVAAAIRLYDFDSQIVLNAGKFDFPARNPSPLYFSPYFAITGHESGEPNATVAATIAQQQQ